MNRPPPLPQIIFEGPPSGQSPGGHNPDEGQVKRALDGPFRMRYWYTGRATRIWLALISEGRETPPKLRGGTPLGSTIPLIRFAGYVPPFSSLNLLPKRGWLLGISAFGRHLSCLPDVAGDVDDPCPSGVPAACRLRASGAWPSGALPIALEGQEPAMVTMRT